MVFICALGQAAIDLALNPGCGTHNAPNPVYGDFRCICILRPNPNPNPQPTQLHEMLSTALTRIRKHFKRSLYIYIFAFYP